MTETLTAESAAPTARPPVRIPQGIEVLPSVPASIDGQLRNILITLVANGNPDNVYRTAQGRPSHAHRSGWITDRSASPYESMFVDGALMNPTPVEGAFYMHPTTNSDTIDGGLHYVSQYRDGEYRIVLPVGPDNTLMWSGRHSGLSTPRAPYYRVKAPLDMIPSGWAYTPDTRTEVTNPSTQMVIRGQETGPRDTTAGVEPVVTEQEAALAALPEVLRPYAEPGAVPNETPRLGVLYALRMYSTGSQSVEFAYPDGDGHTWYVSHDISAPGGSMEMRVNGRSMHRASLTSTSDSTWVRAKLVTVDTLPSSDMVSADERLATLRSEAADLTSRWALYEESLNKVADENSWCPDYERILEPLGMTGRTEKKQRTATVEVTLTWEGDWEHEGISSYQDGLLGEALNFEHSDAVSINRMSMHLSGRVTITRTSIPVDSDGDAVWDDADDLNIDDDTVAAAVTRPTGGSLEVEEFAVESVRVVGFDD